MADVQDSSIVDEAAQRFMSFLTVLDIVPGTTEELKPGDDEFVSQIFDDLMDNDDFTLCCVLWQKLQSNSSLWRQIHPVISESLCRFGDWIAELEDEEE